MSSTPQSPLPLVVPLEALDDDAPRDESTDPEATTEELREEAEVANRIDDPANDDIFEHLRPPKTDDSAG